MKIFAPFEELPLTMIEPEGWLRKYLESQRNGLTGHMESAGYPFNTVGWAAESVPESIHEWGPYEQVGYWIDGAIRCGYLLKDPYLIEKASRHIDYVLAHQDDDGYLGPPCIKKPGNNRRWPHMVFFRAWMAKALATGDARIVEALRQHYLSNTSPHNDSREVCNIEIMLWVYGQTGDERLLQAAVKAYEEFNQLAADTDNSVEVMLSPKRPTEHGVSYNELGKLGAVLYMYTGNTRTLDATINAYRKMDRYAMLIDGVCSSTEQLKGKDPLDSHETCDIADYTWGAGYLLLATGSAEYADKIERACFNAAPGAVTSDFKALQYFSCPNQLLADSTSNHNYFFRGKTWMSYRPNPGTECCPGDVNRVMPNFGARMWLNDGKKGVVAALYAPSRITAKVGEAQQEVTIVEETAYPFSERIDFQIRAAEPVSFTLTIRIPGWCRKPQLLLNEQPLKMALKPGAFVPIHRTFQPNDRLTLILPMEVRITRWPHGGIGVERGPLVYALRIEEDWRVNKDDPRSTPEFPAWNLYPASAWNYALVVDAKQPAHDIEVVQKPLSPNPWTLDSAPIMLRVPARRVSGWTLEQCKQVHSFLPDATFTKLEDTVLQGDYTFTPQLPDPKTLPSRLSRRVETVTLVPYGCTRLRLSIFPRG